jgi:hypothetical protein
MKYKLLINNNLAVDSDRGIDVINKIVENEPCARCSDTKVLKHWYIGKLIEVECTYCKKK